MRGWIILWLSVAASLAAEGTPFELATGEYPPYVTEAQGGGGAAYEIVWAACRRAGLEPRFTFVPWPRAEALVRQGSVVAAFPYGHTPDREAEFDFSASLYRVRNVLVWRTTVGAPAPRIRVLADLRNQTVGAVAGLYILPALAREGISVETTTSLDQAVLMLASGRVDWVVDDQVAIHDAVGRLLPRDVDRFVFQPVPAEAPKENALLVSRAAPRAAALVRRFNEGLAALKASGEYQTLVARWGLVP